MESLVTPALLLPAAISLGLIAYHLASGGPEVVRPLLASRELPLDVVYTLYLCWHIVTIVLTASLVAYLAAAIDQGFRPYALAATVIAGALTLLSFAVVVWKRQKHQEMPQWVVFLLLTISGAWALS
ncbi:hypothetical protein KYK30_30035 [Shinella yambaruensis]|uniref:Uncharacterized protein n=1 Tax=Shinella yambaruensis TaxID=415996 RepID=A0ABQ5ZD51_9HYPH|nr:hypothetical protein [Shinella yambaruensis]MCJ8028712.1 hypothetical protein [Shinella yambaruensis]MCU7983961.1 hypothetical protein [Shinella yambaruensis]GLR49920.1 hypothetical protein GCM10007923_11250 [Shinella yambaruensis]